MTEEASEAGPIVGRRRWSEEERRRIVAESFEPGASVSVVARRHDLNTNLLFTWRRRYGGEQRKAADVAGFVPAVLTSEAVSATASLPASLPDRAGRMEIELPGECRVIVGRDVDTAVLGRIIRTLLQR
jgi:transposase